MATARAHSALHFPVEQHIAFTLEGDLNPTMLGTGNHGQALVGVQFGNAIRPKEFLVAITRFRWTFRASGTRSRPQVRIGHTPPVADAGPDQIGVPAGPITLNASASYSPDGLPIKFQWIADGGPDGHALEPKQRDYQFRGGGRTILYFPLMVTDSLGGTGQARVHVTTSAAAGVGASFFIANPSHHHGGPVLDAVVEHAERDQ